MQTSIKTDGGANISGQVNTEGGKFIGRDEVHNYYGPAYPRLNYRNDLAGILDFYTKIFVGRADAWRAIVDFVGQPTSGYLLVEAPAGYGKSALLAHLVHRQETGQWDRPPVPALLYFFIRHEGSRNTPVAFLQALNSQLLNLLKGEGGVPADLSSLRNQFSALWPQAIKHATVEQPLLLLIDGLDEMAEGETTIADELPALGEAAPFVHVVVSSRPNPKPLEQVAIDHPFKRATVYRLQTFTVAEVQTLLQENQLSPTAATALAERVHTLIKGEPLFARFVCQTVAQQGEAVLSKLEENPPADVEAYFRQQFKQLDEQAEGELTWQILSLLSVTLGGLTVGEIAEVLQQGNRQVRKAIGLIQRFLLGEDKVELMHLQLRKVVVEEVGKQDQARYRQKLLAWSQTYQQQGWPPETPDYILHHYAQHLANEKQWDTLYGLIDQRWMRLKEARTFSHRAFAEDVDLAIAAAEQATDWVQLVRNCLLYATLGELATNVHPKLLSLFAQLGQVERALNYVALIQDRTKQCAVYIRLAQTLFGRSELVKAKKLLDEALMVAERIPDEWSKARALTDISLALAQAGSLDQAIAVANQALAVAEHIPDELEKASVLTHIVQALAQAGSLDQALAVANQILAVAERIPDEKEKASTLRGIDRALAVAERIPDEKKKASTLGDIALALAMAERIPNKWRKADALRDISLALAQAGSLDQALIVANQALAVDEYMPNEQQKAGAFRSIIQALIQIGALDQALAVANQALVVAERIPTEGGRASALTGIVQALAQAGALDQALMVANQILAVAERMPDKWSKAWVLSDVAQALTQARALDQALMVANQALVVANQVLAVAEHMPDEKKKAWILINITQVLAQAGALDQALAVAERIPDELEKACTQIGIAQAVAQTGALDQALMVAERIPDEWSKAQALKDIAQTLAQTGALNQALAVATQALVVAERIPDERQKASALGGIAQTLAQTGALDQALAVATQALAVAERIPDERQKASALGGIAQTLAQTGALDQALAVATQALAVVEHMLDKWSKVWDLTDIVQVLAQTGALDQTLAVAERMPDKWSKAWILSNIAQTLAQTGALDQALMVTERIPDERQKVPALKDIAHGMSAIGQDETMRQRLKQRLPVARLAGREAIFDELDYGAQVLVTLDQGQTLWSVYQAIQEADSWWVSKSPCPLLTFAYVG